MCISAFHSDLLVWAHFKNNRLSLTSTLDATWNNLKTIKNTRHGVNGHVWAKPDLISLRASETDQSLLAQSHHHHHVCAETESVFLLSSTVQGLYPEITVPRAAFSPSVCSSVNSRARSSCLTLSQCGTLCCASTMCHWAVSLILKKHWQYIRLIRFHILKYINHNDAS